MYSVKGYGQMITDQPRMAAYERALRQAITPQSVVLDIGTGTGIFALLACQLGAKKVYAIEPGSAIQLARDLATANGFANRIEFKQALSTDVTLPEKADVIISDLRGVLPLLTQHISSIIDARSRFLAPGGALIPQQDTLRAALVDAPDLFRDYADPWEDNRYNLDMRAGKQFVRNKWQKGRAKPEQHLIKAQTLGTLNYATIDNPNFSGRAQANVTKPGTAHGICLWFDAVLANDATFSNGPDAPELIYGQAFFPLLEPVAVEPGDNVSIEMQADLVGDDYMWRWQTRISAAQTALPKANFEQSTFFAEPLTLDQLQKRAADFVPELNDAGQIDLLILEMMHQNTPLSQIAEAVQRRFSGTFATHQAALTRVGKLSKKYSA